MRVSHQASRMRWRVTLFGDLVRRPKDLWLFARILAWAMALPALKRAVPLRLLPRLMWSRPKAKYRTPERRRRIAYLSGLIYNRYGLESWCLERSLILFRLLSEAGADPMLAVGVEKTDNEWRGHAWVVVNGFPFGESADALERFRPVVIFTRRGLKDETSAHKFK